MLDAAYDMAPHVFTRGVGTAKEQVTRYNMWVVETFASYRGGWIPCRIYGQVLSDKGKALLRSPRRVWNVPNWRTYEIFAAQDRETAYALALDLSRNNHNGQFRIVPYSFDSVEPLGLDPVTQEPISADDTAAATA